MEIITAEWLVTVDTDDAVLPDAGVLFDAGQIQEVGSRTHLTSKHPGTPHRHLAGHALGPGLINAHTHLAMTMFRGLADDCDLQQFLSRVVPAEAAVLNENHVRTATTAGAVESLLGGVTTALDMYYFPDAVLDAAETTGMRIMTGPTFFGGPGPEDLNGEARFSWAEDWVAKHPRRPGWRPVLAPHSAYLVGPDDLRRIQDLAARHDATLHLHAAENAAEIDTVVSMHGHRPVELLNLLGLLTPRTVLAHAVHLSGLELAQIADSGASVSHCPASNLKLGSGIARIPELLSTGVNIGLGTDGPASSNDLDMFTAMRLTALLHKGTTGDATLLPAAQVFRAATMGGAQALGVADSLGSIELGKQADLIAVDLEKPHTQPVYDPLSALVYAAGRADVRHVWVGGEQVVRDGLTSRIDQQESTASLRELQRAVKSAQV